MAKDDAILTQDQIGDMESTAMNGFGHDDHAVRERVYREDIMALIGHINATTRPGPSEGELREILAQAYEANGYGKAFTNRFIRRLDKDSPEGTTETMIALAALRIAAERK